MVPSYNIHDVTRNDREVASVRIRSARSAGGARRASSAAGYRWRHAGVAPTRGHPLTSANIYPAPLPATHPFIFQTLAGGR